MRITAYTDGARNLVPTMAAGCAPAATPGERYRVSVWYRATVSVSLVVHIRRPTGWEYWLEVVRPSTPSFQLATYDLPPIPAGVTAVSFGMSIYAVGEVVTDDYAITPVGGAPVCAAGHVALTYDDGPGPQTEALLDTLAARRARATFFVVGDQVVAREAVVQRAAINGNVVGNHTWTHPHLSDLTDSQVRAELARLDDRLVAIGVPLPTLWRAPYSDTSSHIDGIATGLGLTRTAFAVDVGDSDVPGGISVQETVNRAVSRAQPGAIIILHDLVANSVAATPAIIDGLRGRGFCLGVVRPSSAYDPLNRSYVEVVP